MMRSSIRHRLIGGGALLVLPLLSVASCNDAKLEAVLAALGDGCLIDSDCDDDLICAFRRCHVECETTKDCRDRGESTDCVLADVNRVCLLPDEENCLVEEVETPGGANVSLFLHSTCPSAQLLCSRDAECRNRCELDDDCVGGASCTVTGVCAGDDADDPANAINEEGEAGVPTATCIYSSECIAPLVCRNNQCLEACLTNADCGVGQACTAVESPALGETFGACTNVDIDPDLPASCKNGMLDADESDVDCGGAACEPCPSGSTCGEPSDCASGICDDDDTCKVPSCTDGVANANESDVDCGGPQCAPCTTGQSCHGESDCELALACDPNALVCVAAACGDGVHNGDETGVDCGGSCPTTCAPGEGCTSPSECVSGVCVAGVCQSPSCSDGVRNGNEAGVDCGDAASGCALCGIGASCTQGPECQSGSCQGMICTAPSCTDGVQNGFELGMDCGGPQCAALSQGCALGTACNVDTDCDQTSASGCSSATMLCTAKFTVSITLGGAGGGYVTSNPPGIHCSTGSAMVCQVALFAGESVTLTAYPDASTTFSGFSGGCSGNPSCGVTVAAADVSVTATFD